MEYDMDADSGGYSGNRDYVFPEEGYGGDPAAEAERLPAIDYDLLSSDFSDDAVEITDETPQYADTNPIGSIGESSPTDDTISEKPASHAAAGSFIVDQSVTTEPVGQEAPEVEKVTVTIKRTIITNKNGDDAPFSASSVEEAKERFGEEGMREGLANAQHRPSDFMIRKLRTVGVLENARKEGKARRMTHHEALAMRNSTSAAALAEFGVLPQKYREALAELQKIVNSGQAYDFDIIKQPTTIDAVNVPPILSIFHSHKSNEIQNDAHHEQFEAGYRIVTNYKRTLADVVDAGRHALSGIYKQVTNISTVYRNPISFSGMLGSQQTGVMRAVTRAVNSALNSQSKDPVLAEFMHQSLAKFTWDGHKLPVDAPVSEEYRPQLENIWRTSTLQEGDYLTSPAQIAEGKTPFHKALQAADIVAADGYREAAFALKTHVILEALNREHDRQNGPGTEVKGELAFLNFIVPGAMTGELGLPPKNAHYDYAAGIRNVFDEAWQQAQTETSNGQEGYGVAFLNTIADYYGDELSPYLARSLVNQANRSNVDTVAVLHGLRATGKPWADQLINAVANLPDRPILTNEEARTFAETSLPEATVQSEQVTEAINRFGGDDGTDLYSLKMPLASVANLPRDVNATVHVDISPFTQSVMATINYKNGQMSRQVPLAIELPTGEVNLTTIDDEPLDPVTAGRYKAIIEKAIVTHDQQNQETLAEAKVQPSGGMQRAPITTPTRDQSIQPERTEPKLKTRGVAAENNDTPAIPSADKSSEARPISGVRISGATLENITDLLGDQNIKDIPPSQIALKLDFLLKKAEETGTSFGRQAPLVGVRGADKVTLRELKWITGAGHRQIRIYFEDNGRGQLTLCGIYDKRGANSHLNNLKKLVTKLERG